MKQISEELYSQLEYLGIINSESTRSSNVGKSDYSKHLIQPWTIWLSYPDLNPWDADIIKRVLRNKEGDSRKLDYEKIIHICNERIRQIEFTENKSETINKTDPTKVEPIYKGTPGDLLDQVETDRFNTFRSKHKHKGQYALHTLSFTPTGIGNDIVVECSVCKERENITNVDNW